MRKERYAIHILFRFLFIFSDMQLGELLDIKPVGHFDPNVKKAVKKLMVKN